MEDKAARQAIFARRWLPVQFWGWAGQWPVAWANVRAADRRCPLGAAFMPCGSLPCAFEPRDDAHERECQDQRSEGSHRSPGASDAVLDHLNVLYECEYFMKILAK